MRLARWSKFLILIASAEVLMGASGCPSNAPPFEWNPQIWSGDSRTQSVVNGDNGRVSQILCRDQEFDQLVCMDNSEIANARAAYFKVINQCDHWKTPAAEAAAQQFPVEER